MKFSYRLLKQLWPGIGSKQKLVEQLERRLFEVDGVVRETLEVSVLPNRWSDAAAHLGLAAEIAAISGRSFRWPEFKYEKRRGGMKIKVIEKKECGCYLGVVMELKRSTQTDKYIRQVLDDCGQRPLNAVVDMINYATLLTGQPLHAFDYEKVEGMIAVRRAKKGERMTTLDGRELEFEGEELVIADQKGLLALAGIKGGTRAEVTEKTKKIILEAANFNQRSIFRTARRLGIETDASARFAHGLSPELAFLGMSQAVKILRDKLGGEVVGGDEFYPRPVKARRVVLTEERLAGFLGVPIRIKEAAGKLRRLGFGVREDGGRLAVTVPLLRIDVEGEQDLVEEVVRLMGVDELKPVPPVVSLAPAEVNELLVARRQAREILTGLGLDESYNTSFVSEAEGRGAPELANPIADDKRRLRPSLLFGLRRNARNNLRFFSEAGLFEIGRVFSEESGGVEEKEMIAMAVAARGESRFLELKGVVETWLARMGLVGAEMNEQNGELAVFVSGQKIGRLGERDGVAEAEFDLKRLLELATREIGYKEIIRYPAVVRDISLLVEKEVRAGEVLRAIREAGLVEIRDVDLIDFYEDAEKLGEGKRSLTFRVFWQSAQKSLTDTEVGGMVKKITEKLIDEFGAEVR